MAMSAQQRAFIVGFRQRLMTVLLHMNSSNFGQACQHLHDAIKDYDGLLQILPLPKKPRKSKRRHR